ncbi:MAG: DUF2149 domain-containing protein [Deltaproteobacteria bacterium]|jgi:hypothetical protein|nr:DUF2149 domain-containing protein [Deltaproteobacteria bacterium]MDR1297503.1 DUF2149 domain-containing protein [Deltaproteobacteria bacterium]
MARLGRRLGSRTALKEADDPMLAVINLIDIFLVFIVAVLISFLSALGLGEILSKDSEVTVVKKTPDGEMTIITKTANRLEASRITRTEAEGRGVRLGVAYRLEDGSMVYMPDDEQE